MLQRGFAIIGRCAVHYFRSPTPTCHSTRDRQTVLSPLTRKTRVRNIIRRDGYTVCMYTEWFRYREPSCPGKCKLYAWRLYHYRLFLGAVRLLWNGAPRFYLSIVKIGFCQFTRVDFWIPTNFCPNNLRHFSVWKCCKSLSYGEACSVCYEFILLETL